MPEMEWKAENLKNEETYKELVNAQVNAEAFLEAMGGLKEMAGRSETGRCIAVAYTKLEEFLLWVKRAKEFID